MSARRGKRYDDICILYIESHQNSDWSFASRLCRDLSKRGYVPSGFERIYPDLDSYVTRAIKDVSKSFKNVVICCGERVAERVERTAENFLGLNLSGGACDFSGSTIFYCRPGGGMTDEEICATLDAKYCNDFCELYFKTVAAPGRLLDEAAEKVGKICSEADVFFDADGNDALMSVIYPKAASDKMKSELSLAILENLNDYVYAMDDVSLAGRLVELLKLRHMKISVAESFTGGGVGRKIVQIPGASNVFFESINTYDNTSKMMRLGVSEITLRRHGAVSQETAYEMALGLLKNGVCDLAVSTTGIAGPKSDDTNKPVGLCYIGVGTADFVDVFQLNLEGDRRDITEAGINLALFYALKAIK